MSTITAILEPDADGSLHVPLPPELQRRKVRIEAKLEAADDEDEVQKEAERQKRLLAALDAVRARNPFGSVKDPVAWQREMRTDRELPGRE